MAGADGESGAGRADGRPAGAAAGRVAAAGRSRRAVGTLVRDLRRAAAGALRGRVRRFRIAPPRRARRRRRGAGPRHPRAPAARLRTAGDADQAAPEGTLFALAGVSTRSRDTPGPRSEEHTSELQSLMRISYSVFC